MKHKFKLSNQYPKKRAFITGASTGLGFEFANFLINDGWIIGLTDINKENLTKQFNDKENVFLYFFDVSNAQEFEKASLNFVEKVGGIDVLFNNAGVGEGSYFEQYSLKNWDWIIGINQKGVINGCHFFIPILKKEQNGMIVNIASAAGYANLPKMSPYNVTKASVIALSESLYGELKPHNVKVIAVTPTFFQSNILGNSRGDAIIKKSAERVVNNSKMNAKDAALLILRKLPKAKRHIRFPFSASLLFYAKKWMPSIYWWAIIKKLSK